MSEELINIINCELEEDSYKDIGFTIEKFNSKLFDDIHYIKNYIEKRFNTYQKNEMKILFFRYFGLFQKSFYKVLEMENYNHLEDMCVDERTYAYRYLNAIYFFFEGGYYLCKKSNTLYNFLILLIMQLLPDMYFEDLINDPRFIKQKELIERINYIPSTKNINDIIEERNYVLDNFRNITKEYVIKRSRTN